MKIVCAKGSYQISLFWKVVLNHFWKVGDPGNALLLRIGKEACPIFLGSKTLPRLICLDLFFCLFKFIFLGSVLTWLKTYISG